MQTYQNSPLIADAELVARSRRGETEAFGRLVERYQSLICALAYSACGDVTRSEDIAQETFITAWRQLDQLREPEHIKAWLCGITRNLVSNAQRQLARRREDAVETLDGEDTAHSIDGASPDHETISREEADLMWRSLSELPEQFREPLVLYYREQQSVQKVAAALDLSEDAVKQRLARGRALLREQIAARLEGVLTRTAPGKVFTLAVITALPALAPQAAVAGVAAAATKGSATAQAAVSAGFLGALIGPLIGILGGYLGARASIQNARPGPEREFVKRVAWVTTALVLVFALGIFALTYFGRDWLRENPRAYVIALVSWILLYISVLFVGIVRANRRQLEIRAAEELKNPPAKMHQPIPILHRRYESKARLLGIPLLVIEMSNTSSLRPAVGWIAIGNTAFGILFAFGGVACGGIAVGGIACGVISFGGIAFGGLALGGLAIGWWAVGGGAVAWSAALGGLAWAHDVALGGLAIAQHANDDTARQFFTNHPVLSLAQRAMKHARWITVLSLLPFALMIWQTKKSQPSSTK